jgi:outer membrane protein insertion porin family
MMTKVGSRRGRRAAYLAVATALTLGAASLPAFAQSIVVQGNQRVDADTVRSYFQQGPLDAAGIDRAIKEMIASGRFSDVRVRRDGGRLVVTVVENAVVNRVTFEGNSRVKSEQLFQEVQTRARGPYSRQIVDADVQRIQEIYRRVGRSDAQIQTVIADAPNGRVDVTFRITEGAKTGVASIEFVGNNAFSSSRLRNVMTTTESNFLSFLKTSDIYDAERLSSDLELIRRFYLKNGYADFRVVGSDARFDETRRGYVITISVDEGEQYRVGDVQLDSRIPQVDAAQLRRRLRTSPGDIYNAEQVEKTVETITTDVARGGYPFVQVRPSGNRDTANRRVNIAFSVEEGPRVYVERINIRGNTRTRDYVIRREFDLGEGDAFNRALIDRAERRLKNLGYFKTVRITNEPGSSPDRVVVNVEVEDQPTGQFSIGGGYSTADGAIGEISVTERNFLGRGQFVRLAGNTGQRSRGIDFSFTEPYFLEQRLSAGFDLFYRESDNNRFNRYDLSSVGGTVRFGLPIDDNFSIGLRYSLFQQEIDIPNTTERPFNDCSFPIANFTPTGASVTSFNSCIANGEASIALKEARGRTITSLVGFNLTYNTLDNNQTPTSGFLAELRPEIAGLGGDSKFARVTGEARYYYPIWDEVVGMVKAQGGHIQAFGDDKLRLIDHFNLGPTLVRGFAPSGIGPRDTTVDPRNNPLGGTTYFGVSAEVQFPIFGLPREIGLKGAVFADAGTLFDYKGTRAFDVNRNGVISGLGPTGCVGSQITQVECLTVRDKNVIRSSVGVGLLWNSPLGPIRFDYSFPLSKDSFDRVQNFRFSGGARF